MSSAPAAASVSTTAAAPASSSSLAAASTPSSSAAAVSSSSPAISSAIASSTTTSSSPSTTASLSVSSTLGSASGTAAVVVAAESAIPSSNSTGIDSATAKSSSLSGGAIGGIVGGVIGGIVVLAALFWFWKRYAGKKERERYPLPPPRAVMSQRPMSTAGSAMLGAPRRMPSGNVLTSSLPTAQSFAERGRRGSSYSAFGPPLAPPRRPYASSTSSSRASHGLVDGQGSSSTSYESSQSSSSSSSPLQASGEQQQQQQHPSSESSVTNSPVLQVVDGFSASPMIAGPSQSTANGSFSAHDSPPLQPSSRQGSISSRSSASFGGPHGVPPVPPLPGGSAGVGMTSSGTARQLRISTASLSSGAHNTAAPQRRHDSRYSMSSVSSSRSLHGSSSLRKASGTPHGGRAVNITLPTPLAAPAEPSWTMATPTARPAAADGEQQQGAGYFDNVNAGSSRRPTRVQEEWSAGMDEHGRLSGGR